jgi:hypothetical protein
MKKWDKEIWIGKVGVLLTNYLSLGFSIKKSPYNNDWFHINLGSCQICFDK